MILVLGACADETPVIHLYGKAGTPLGLVLEIPLVPTDHARYRWELVEAPAESVAIAPPGSEATAVLTPDLRGQYLVDRWIDVGLSSDLTHHIVVIAQGEPPSAQALTGNANVTTGMTAVLDGSSSSSRERRTLTYRWKLASRPPTSQTELVSIDQAQTMLVPDVVGSYTVELTVFDGELWSDNVASQTISAFAP